MLKRVGSWMLGLAAVLAVLIMLFIPTIFFAAIAWVNESMGIGGLVGTVLFITFAAFVLARREQDRTIREARRRRIIAGMWGWLALIAGFWIASMIGVPDLKDGVAQAGRLIAVIMGFGLFGLIAMLLEPRSGHPSFRRNSDK